MALSLYRKENNILSVVNSSLWDLPSPSSMSYFWNFGSTLGICLLIQIASGFLLTFHYTSFADESFNSIVSIMRDVWSGWVIRYVHMNGASFFFFFVYLHMFRGLFFMSSVNKGLWVSGVLILIILMAISFLGYVLPWGQMSYWAVAVITNLFSVIPLVGNDIVVWIWGGFAVGSPTLNRFYSLHFLAPFILTFMVFMHLLILHSNGSSSNIGVSGNVDKIPFHPYFSVKDSFFIFLFIMAALMVSFYFPLVLGDTVNNVPANPMQTPLHIQPEWYFLTSYAILRGMPTKVAGVIALAFSVGIFFFLPLFNLKFSTKFSGFRYLLFWVIVSSFLFLTVMGSMEAEEPFIFLSKTFAFIYFSSILLLNV